MFLRPVRFRLSLQYHNRGCAMRILIIDDEVDFLTIMESVLLGKGYEVIKAQDGKQAREAMEGEKIDLILSDVFMPTLDGARFHTFVREYTDSREVPFIFISAYDDEHLRDLASKSPIDFFLRKPTPIEDILAMIEKALRTSPRDNS